MTQWSSYCTQRCAEYAPRHRSKNKTSEIVHLLVGFEDGWVFSIISVGTHQLTGIVFAARVTAAGPALWSAVLQHAGSVLEWWRLPQHLQHYCGCCCCSATVPAGGQHGTVAADLPRQLSAIWVCSSLHSHRLGKVGGTPHWQLSEKCSVSHKQAIWVGTCSASHQGWWDGLLSITWVKRYSWPALWSIASTFSCFKSGLKTLFMIALCQEDFCRSPHPHPPTPNIPNHGCIDDFNSPFNCVWKKSGFVKHK